MHAMLVGHYPSPHLTDKTQTQYFARPAWSQISREGLDLLGLLLRQHPSNRPTASIALKHPWCAAAVASRVILPEPLLTRVPTAVQVFSLAPALRRLALHAVAREVDDLEIAKMRNVLQLLELRCDGSLTRSALLSAAGMEGSVGEAATVIYRNFDALVGSDVGAGPRLIWTELVALILCIAPATEVGVENSQAPGSLASGASVVSPLSENACWRAFDLLSQGTGTVTSSTLAEFMPHNRGSVDAINGDAMDALVTEVFPNGQMVYSEFLKLLRGEFQEAKHSETGLISKCACLLRCFQCNSKGNATGTSSQNREDTPQRMPPSHIQSAIGKPAEPKPNGHSARTQV